MADDGGAAARNYPNYEQGLDKATKFLLEYDEPRERRFVRGPASQFTKEQSDSGDDQVELSKYQSIMQEIANREVKDLPIEVDDLITFFGHDPAFVEEVKANGIRYREVFASAAYKNLPEAYHGAEDKDVLDVLMTHRGIAANGGSGGGDSGGDGGGDGDQDKAENFPDKLKQRFQVRLVPESTAKPVALRDIKAPSIGGLVTTKGIVTRISDVRPLLTVATYTCDTCGFEIYQQVNSKAYTPIFICPSAQCQQNKTNGKLHHHTRGSKFEKFQELKLQEMPNQVPIGHIPRSMTVHVRGEITRTCGTGDMVTIGGIFLPTPYTGMQAMRAGLLADTYLEAMSIERHKKSFAEMELTPEMEEAIDEAEEDADVYGKLARSIAPEIFGHEDVKKALLLQLVGGVTRKMKDGMSIRGDINICLMGDPGVAKSQLLKHMSRVAPRGIYTTGKGSSGVGLTAAVVRDNVTQEMTLEGGALVLADMGLCCIDEFDKMEEGDRTAIHEVMEQQTVSIAKAGITTTLNARTAILAAANPRYGRYNRYKSPTENIDLPAALLSRFDLMFLLLDKPDIETDTALAQHITHVHRFRKPKELDFEPYDEHFIRAYVASARRMEPFVPPEVAPYIVESYVQLRAKDVLECSDNGHFAETMMTARQLLSILRLSQSLARLRFADSVSQDDAEEAMRLVQQCKACLNDDDDNQKGEDITSQIYNIIRDHIVSVGGDGGGGGGVQSSRMDDIENMVLRRGFKKEQLELCIETYANMDVWILNKSRTLITLIDSADAQ